MYTLNYGSNSSQSIQVNDGETTSIANLVLPGQNFSGYGPHIDQNFLSMVENFASAANTGPRSSIVGQLWYDTANANANLQGLKINVLNTTVSNVTTATWTLLSTKSNDGKITANSLELNGGNITNANVITANTGAIATITATTVNATGTLTAGIITANGNLSAGNVNVTNKVVTNNLEATSNITGSNITVANMFNFGTSTTTANSSLLRINVDANGVHSVVIEGNLQVNGVMSATSANSTSSTPLTVSGSIINLATSVTVPDSGARGIDMKYFIDGSGNLASRERHAFFGIASSNTDPNTFVLASNANTMSSSATGLTLANLTLNKVTGNVVGDVQGKLYNGVSSVSIPSTSGNIHIKVNGANTIDATTTGVAITGNANISGIANITGALIVVGNIGTSSQGANITASSNNTLSSNTVSANYIFGSIQTGPQPNITAVGTLGSLKVTGNIVCNNFTTNGSASFGSITLGSVKSNTITSGSNVTVGTIEGNWTLTAGSKLQATYADLAERHHADAVYPVGTVMTVGGVNEITAATTSDKILGVVSTDWAYLMNGDAGTQETHPAVAYVGRVPVRVVGPITKLSPVSPLDGGTAQAGLSNQFGWALETNLDVAEKLVLCLIK